MYMQKMVGRNSSELPPGFRFHPTDEELIMYYLRHQATSRPCPVAIIPEVDIYKFDPWQLPEKADFGETEWYFFSPRERKYPNGVRPNRSAVSGYWKATGTDKSIYSGSKFVGVKKALVFYEGKPPKGIKTDWIMHEYRLSDSSTHIPRKNGSMRLDDWVLCRIYKKKSLVRTVEKTAEEESSAQMVASNGASDSQMSAEEDSSAQMVASNGASNSQMSRIPTTCSLSQLWELDGLASLPRLLSDNISYNSNLQTNYQNPVWNAGNGFQ